MAPPAPPSAASLRRPVLAWFGPPAPPSVHDIVDQVRSEAPPATSLVLDPDLGLGTRVGLVVRAVVEGIDEVVVADPDTARSARRALATMARIAEAAPS